MLKMGNCTKCGTMLGEVTMNEIDIHGSNESWKGVSYCCPNCKGLVGVGIDPFGLMNLIISQVLLKLQNS